jgi:pyruvate-formate lyase-activating enzyme
MAPSDSEPAFRSLGAHRTQTVATSFACNNRCRTCLIAGLRNTAAPMDREEFRRHVDENAETRLFDRLVLSGGEVTLDAAFLENARYARQRGHFRHIRVQSNGRRFADPEFLRASIEAGVDEYYISVRAHDAAVDAQITGELDSFRETSAGLSNIAKSGATLITNTPVSSMNVEHLSAIVDHALGFRPARLELYGFLPTTRAQRALMAPAATLERHVLEALRRIPPGGPEIGILWMPRCLLGDGEKLFVSEMPALIIGSDFWRAFPPFACFFERVCLHHPACLGLPVPYIEAHGYEHDLLRPALRSAGKGRRARRADQAPLGPQAWMDLLRGPDGRPMRTTRYWTLVGVETFADHVVFHFGLPEGPLLDVVIRERDDARPHHAQTHSFNVSIHPKDPAFAPRPLVNRFTATIAAVLARNDDGYLAFAEQVGP